MIIVDKANGDKSTELQWELTKNVDQFQYKSNKLDAYMVKNEWIQQFRTSMYRTNME